MYESYFGLRESPFNVTPNPRCCLCNSSLRQALATLRDGIERRAGIIVITGEAGTGKTTLLKMFLGSADPKVHASCILDPHLTFSELLSCAAEVFELSEQALDGQVIMQRLNRYLIEQFSKDRAVALLLDEAQGLSDEVLDGIGLLADLEKDGKKLLQIILIGQPELESKIGQSSLSRLEERVALRARLAPLGSGEIDPYIEFRLSAAGYTGHRIFVGHAVERIHVYSKGIPRLVNVICDNALLIACTRLQHRVGGEIIEEVARELQLEGSHSEKTASGLTKTPRPHPGEMPERYNVFDETCENSLKDVWTLDAESMAKAGTEEPVSAPRVYFRRAVLPVALGTLITIVGGTLLFSFREQNSLAIPPVSHNVKKIKDALAPIPERIYRAMSLHSEDRPNYKVLARSRSDPSGDVQSAGSRKLIKIDRQSKPAARPAVKERRDAKIANSPKRSSSQASLRVVGNSIVRNKPSSDAEVVATLHPGAGIQLIGRAGDYFHIRTTQGDAVRGYVHREDAFFAPPNKSGSQK